MVKAFGGVSIYFAYPSINPSLKFCVLTRDDGLVCLLSVQVSENALNPAFVLSIAKHVGTPYKGIQEKSTHQTKLLFK